MAAAAREAAHSRAWALTGEVAGWMTRLARGEGLDLEGYSHMVDASAVKHVLARHSDLGVEASRAQLPITVDDIARLPEILAEPDKVVFGLRSADGLAMVAFAKRLANGSTIVLEEVRTGRRRLALKTMWKVPAAANIESALSTLRLDVRNVGELRISIIDVSDEVKGAEPPKPD